MTHIEQRIDTAANWAAANPVLNEGEVGWESDTRKSKLGDGVTAWNDLSYTMSAISATKADVGLGQVDNTADVDKPLSAPQQTYIDAGDADLQAQVDAKAPLASPVFTGNPTAPTPAPGDNDESLATTAFVKSALDTALPSTKLPPVVCTSTSRPANVEGQFIYETDTDRVYVGDGTNWNQVLIDRAASAFPKYVASSTPGNPVLATTWTAEAVGAGVLTASFVAPESKRVKITLSAYLYQATAGKLQQFGYKWSDGVTRDPTDDEALKVLGVGAISASRTFVVTGLTAGATYTLTSAHKTDAGGSNPYIGYRNLLIELL